MQFQETKLAGAFLIELDRFQDERGYFAEVWKSEIAKEYGIVANFGRTNLSFNQRKGTLRGLHAQAEPHAEAKLVRCIQGAIVDVIVDFRPGSPTYLQWVSVELSAENQTALYIPRGFLHGFQTLVDNTTVFYQVDGAYHPQCEFGVRFDDPVIGIEWPQATGLTISEKDQSWAALVPKSLANSK